MKNCCKANSDKNFCPDCGKCLVGEGKAALVKHMRDYARQTKKKMDNAKRRLEAGDRYMNQQKYELRVNNYNKWSEWLRLVEMIPSEQEE